MSSISRALRNEYLIEVGVPVAVVLALLWAFLFVQVDAGIEQLYVIVAGGASILSVVLVLAGQHRRTAASLAQLEAKVAEVEEGNPNVDFETDRSDEVGDLYDAVGRVSDSLQSRVIDLSAERDELQSDLRKQKRLNRHLLERIAEYTDVIRGCSPDDPSPRMEPDGKVPQLRRHAREFNTLMSDVERRTGDVAGSDGEGSGDQFTITPPEPESESGSTSESAAAAPGAGKTVAEVKEIVTGAYPDDELPWHLYNRLFLKTGINLDDRPDDEVLTEEEVDELVDAAGDIVGELTTV